jgi:PAS domain S-box-containing protein
MAQRMRSFDWSQTALGDPRGWPEGLKIPLRMLLTSRFEMWLGWGDDLLFFYNDAYAPTLGLKHPSALARPFREVWSEVYADVADQVATVRAGEATWNKALLLLLERSGRPEETYHSFSYSPLYEANGEVGGLLCVVTEETERVIGERRLETLRSLGMGLVGVTNDAAVRRAVCTTFENNRRDFPFAMLQLKDEESFSACTEDVLPLAESGWANRLKEENAGASLSHINLDSGATWPAGAWQTSPRKAILVPVPGPAGNTPFGYLILGLNPYQGNDQHSADFAQLIAGQISGALANIASLDAERRRADRIWSHTRDLIVVVDEAGKFRAVSPSWTRIFGHQTEDVVGRYFADFIDPEDLESSTRALAEALNEGDLIGYENRFLTQAGEPRWISWHTAMEDGLVYAYGRDITEHKQAADALATAEDALRQSQKMEAVGQLTGGIAHDFNNLLQGITGSLDIMKSRLSEGRTEDLSRWLAGAAGSAEKAAALTHRLLAFARRQPLDPRPVRANPLIASMEDMLRRTLGEGVHLECLHASDLWETLCDPNQLESAVLNLVINARDAMPDGGTLTIETRNAQLNELHVSQQQDSKPGQYVCLTVTDTGTGMDKDTIQRAFEPFFTTKPLGQGTGLGLSMIYGFARQSDGHVQIDSKVGHGTSIKLYLPRHQGAGSSESPALETSQASKAGDGEVVLLVEDEPVVRGLIMEVLADLGYNAIEADDGPTGLSILQSQKRIDLLVTDIGLPGLNGRQIADAARKSRPDLKVLFMTGYAENAAMASGFLEDGMEMITKPFAMDALATRIREIISGGTGD